MHFRSRSLVWIEPTADAAVTSVAGAVLVILTAGLFAGRLGCC